tara:strand:- start:750 stop:1604 length:855 start_codon:yes stop_codon:yes gene_type:complete
MKVKYFYDSDTSTFSYLIIDQDTSKCAIIDSVLDYNIYTGKFETTNVDIIIEYIKNNNLKCEWILETHIHADHITAAGYLKSKLNAKIGIGIGVKSIINYWVNIFNINKVLLLEGEHFDKLFNDNEIIHVGNLEFKVLATPGHTPGCVSYYVEDNIFVGDTLFMPSTGTARADFPGGSASSLYISIKRILDLPSNTKIYICHDYPENSGEEQCLSTVEIQNKNNILINKKISLSEFIKLRNKKDAGKEPPKLIYPSIQVNIRNGDFGEQESNGKQYIKIPINSY